MFWRVVFLSDTMTTKSCEGYKCLLCYILKVGHGQANLQLEVHYWYVCTNLYSFLMVKFVDRMYTPGKKRSVGPSKTVPKYHSTPQSLIQYEIGLYPNSRWTLQANSVKVFILLKYKKRTFRSLYLIILVIWFTTKLQLELFSDQYYISHHGFWPTPTSLLIITHMKNPKVHIIIPMPLLLIRYEVQCVWTAKR